MLLRPGFVRVTLKGIHTDVVVTVGEQAYPLHKVRLGYNNRTGSAWLSGISANLSYGIVGEDSSCSWRSAGT